MTPIPRLPDGRVSWSALLAGAAPGSTYVLPKRMYSSAVKTINDAGFSCRSKVIGDSVHICLRPRPVAAAESAAETINAGRIANRIIATQQQIAKWKLAANERETRAGRTQAGALVLLYESQLRHLRQQLSSLLPTTA